MLMKAKDVLRKKFPFLRPNDTIKKAIQLMLKIPESAVPVVDKKGKIVGEIRQRDFLEKFQTMPEERILGPSALRQLLEKKAKKVEQIMERISIEADPEDDITYLAKLMYEYDLCSIPIIAKGKVIGMVTEIDLLKVLK